MPRLSLLLVLTFLPAFSLTAQQDGMAVDSGLALPTDGDTAGPMPEQPKSRNVQIIGGDEGDTPTETILQNAFVAYKNGDYEAALSKINKVLGNEPKNAKAKLLLGRVQLAQRKYPEATETMITAVELDPQVPRGQYHLGEALLAQHKLLEARGAFAAQMKTEPENKDAQLLYAMCEAALRNFQEASDVAIQFDPMDPIHPGHNFANAAIAQASGKPDKATEELDNARTTYGPKIWTQYMKYYLQVFPPKKSKQADTGAAAAPVRKASPVQPE